MSKKLKRIAIDARFFGEAGPGRYTKNIVKHLEKIDNKNLYYVFLRDKGWKEYEPQSKNFRKVRANYPWYSFKEQLFFLFAVLKVNPDLFYVPHFNIPVLYPKKIVTAIPDIIMHTFSTEKGTTLPKPYFRIKKSIYKQVIRIAVWRSQKIIVPSTETLNDFLKTFPAVSKEKFVLAYEGIDPDIKTYDGNAYKVLEKYGISQPYLLYISSMYEHKNVPRLIEAFNLLKKDYNYPGQLVLVGKKDKFSERINEIVKQKDLEKDVLMPGLKGYVSDDNAAALRSMADVYVFPSLKEGFSLTPMESMKFNLACVISDIACHKEIYQDSVEYFDPYNPKDMAEKINKVISDEKLKKELIGKGQALIKKYSWDDTARITLEVFNNALHN